MPQPLRITNLSESGESDESEGEEYIPGSRDIVVGPTHQSPPATRAEVSLPNHVLEKILVFHHHKAAKVIYSGAKAINRHPGTRIPFALAKVNRQFRSVTMDTRELWSLIFVNFALDNVHLSARLNQTLSLVKDAPLTLCFQDVRESAFNRPWFRALYQSLTPTAGQWVKFVASFSAEQDLASFLRTWPLANASKLHDLQLCGWWNANPLVVPRQAFLTPFGALKHVEIRDVAWVHREVVPTVDSLNIGPSNDLVLGPTTLKNILQSFPNISKLRVLTFETSRLTAYAEPQLDRLQLLNVVHLTVSAILLRTSMQGFENGRVLPALMSVSVHFSPQDDEDSDEDEEDEETTRRNEDLAAVGRFLRDHQIQVLKLNNLDEGYSPSAFCTSLLRTMSTIRLRELYLINCADCTTDYIGVALTPVMLYPETPRTLEQGRVPRIQRLNQGAIHLLPKLKRLLVYKCRNIDREEFAKYVQNPPRGLKEVVIRRCDDFEDCTYPYGISSDVPHD